MGVKPSLSILCSALIIAAVVQCDSGFSLRQLLNNEPKSQTSTTGDNDPQHSAVPIDDPSVFWYDRLPHLPPIDLHALNNDPRFDARVSERIATNALDMAHDIGATVLAESTKGSEVFSPLSIYSALSLLLLGASGTTFDELLRLMHFDSDAYLTANPWKIHEDFGLLLEDVTRVDGQNPTRRRAPTAWKVHRGPAMPSAAAGGSYRDDTLSDYRVSVANGLFVQQGYSLRADYRTAVLGIYRSNLKTLDFEHDAAAATSFINEIMMTNVMCCLINPEQMYYSASWVNRKTEGKIPKIISEQLNPKTKIVMASALYFNAMWEKTFYEGATGPKNFYPDGLSEPPITVDMMGNGGRFPFYDAKEFDCRIIGLPYKHNMTTMYIIQPNNSNRQRLRDLQARLTADRIESMIAHMQWETSIVLLPKMKITNQLNLKDVLNKMGARALFNEVESDLSLISSGTGTEDELAAGQTYVQPPMLSSLPSRINVALPGASDHIDEPFIFSSSYDDESTSKSKAMRRRRNVITYKVPSESKTAPTPLTMKSFILDKRITKTKVPLSLTSSPAAASGKKSLRRARRQVDLSESIKQLDGLRKRLRSPVDAPRIDNNESNGLFVDEILHQVDLTVNEKGTEGGAATVTTLFRTGTDVVMRVETPFMFLIRHDETKLPLFYGAVFEPSNIAA